MIYIHGEDGVVVTISAESLEQAIRTALSWLGPSEHKCQDPDCKLVKAIQELRRVVGDS